MPDGFYSHEEEQNPANKVACDWWNKDAKKETVCKQPKEKESTD